MFSAPWRMASVGVRFGTLQLDRAEAAHLIGRPARAALPGVRLAHAAVVHQRQALALGVLEVERQAAVALGDLLGHHAVLAQILRPPGQRLAASDAQVRAG